MTSRESPLAEHRRRIATGDLDARAAAENAHSHANSNVGKNVYLSLDPDWTVAEATAILHRSPGAMSPLYGLPVSVKDCFDLSGFPTSCGSRFYAAHNGVASSDSWVAEKLRNQGAVITGKTHLHQLAYGITGENADYGDSTQPRNPSLLTGGSSSGAAASVQEGSAVAAIGTDTGGSIRVPAALCGLAGYRSSLGLGDWRGAAHLAPSFDTLGWLFLDLRDAPLLAHALLDVPIASHSTEQAARVGAIDSEFLFDCDPDVLAAFEAFKEELKTLGILIGHFESHSWAESFEIFSAIQASEAALIHAGFFDRFEPAIAERLAWGASISADELSQLRARHALFRRAFDRLFAHYDFLIVPCAPVSSLLAGADHSATRKTILRYTTPASLAGTPVVAVPLAGGAGVQLIGRHGSDAALVAFAAYLGEHLAL
jgi:Asp-tRNA(Asn)/Glu-tRNA(Gln) amidotransferase A subunit family amidase